MRNTVSYTFFYAERSKPVFNSDTFSPEEITVVLGRGLIGFRSGKIALFPIENTKPQIFLGYILLLWGISTPGHPWNQHWSKQYTRHAERENFATLWQCNAAYCNSDPNFIELCWLGSFGSNRPIPRTLHSVFSIFFSLFQTSSLWQPLKWWWHERHVNGRDFLIIGEGGEFLWRGYWKYICKVWKKLVAMLKN